MAKNQIVVERRVRKRIDNARIREQLSKIATTALKGGRGSGWTFNMPPRLVEPTQEGNTVVYRVTLSFTTTQNRDSLLDKWDRIVKRFAEAGAAAPFRATPWTVIEPTGYSQIATKAQAADEKAKNRKVMQEEDKVLGEINLEPNGHYSRLYNREPQINRILGALRLGQRTDWLKRTHSILDGPPGCHIKGTGVLKSNGYRVSVEDVVVGDRLLSHDGYRTVQELVRGTGRLYRIVPVKGDSFTVNEDHILTLAKCRNPNKGSWIDVTVKEWLTWTDWQKSNYRLPRSGKVEFETDKKNLPIDSYSLGLLLGDGSLIKFPRFTSHMDDFPFLPEITMLAESFGLTVTVYPRNNQFEVSLTNPHQWRSNGLQQKLRELGVGEKKSESKFIPEIYKTASYKSRLELLAGLIDTDGDQHGNVICIDSKSKQLIDDVIFVARSLGFAAYYGSKTIKKGKYKGRIYHRAHLSGDLYLIPCRLKRKMCHPRLSKKNVLVTGFDIEPAGQGDYYGFVIDGDHRYLMDDFTVIHNCGKTEIMLSTSRMLGKENEAWRWFDATSMTKAGVLEELIESPVVPPVLFIEEIEKCDESSLRWLLGVMDTRGQIRRTNYRVGNQAKHVRMCVIASANDVNLLRSLMSGALYSRFQNKIYCPRPDRVVMEQILKRECDEIDGKMEWIEPTLQFAYDSWYMTDPRDVITIMSCGGDDLLDGKYQADYEATMHPSEKSRLLKAKKKRDGGDGEVKPKPKHPRKTA